MKPLRLVSSPSKPNSENSDDSSDASNLYSSLLLRLPPVMRKVWTLYQLRPRACAVIERLVDELLTEIDRGLL